MILTVSTKPINRKEVISHFITDNEGFGQNQSHQEVHEVVVSDDVSYVSE
jgi:hypothetical protein